MEWIAVKEDQLPIIGQSVIAIKSSNNKILDWLYGYGNKVFIGCLESKTETANNKVKYTWRFVNEYCFTDVKYWMPLPNPPKE